MFKRTIVASVALPRSAWEPIRKLHDLCNVDLGMLTEAWNVSSREMAKVLYAARLEYLCEGEEGEVFGWKAEP